MGTASAGRFAQLSCVGVSAMQRRSGSGKAVTASRPAPANSACEVSPLCRRWKGSATSFSIFSCMRHLCLPTVSPNTCGSDVAVVILESHTHTHTYIYIYIYIHTYMMFTQASWNQRWWKLSSRPTCCKSLQANAS